MERELGDGGRDFTGDFYVEMAQDLERAKFDPAPRSER
jgi:hypothetical protein